MCDDMQAAGVDGVIVQAITGLDGISYTRQQLQKTLDRGFRIAGYVWCFPGGPSVASRLSMFDGFKLEWLALDNEQAGLSFADMDRDFALCDAYMGGQLTEDYTAYWFYQLMGWLRITRYSNRALWYAAYDEQAAMSSFVPFGGWTTPRTHQFTDKQLYGGVALDVNFRVPSAG